MQRIVDQIPDVLRSFNRFAIHHSLQGAMKRISIDPITRLEGHGKIEIFLDDDGRVANCYSSPRIACLEKFVEGCR